MHTHIHNTPHDTQKSDSLEETFFLKRRVMTRERLHPRICVSSGPLGAADVTTLLAHVPTMSFTVSATAARAVASPAFVSKASSKVRFVLVYVFVSWSFRARRATRDAHRDVTSWTPPARAARERDARVRTRASVSGEWYPVT